MQPVVISFESSGIWPNESQAGDDGKDPVYYLIDEKLPGPFVMGQVDGEGEPYKIKALNMVPEIIHKGKLCQAKRMIIGEDEILLIDVEPCD